MKLFLGVSLLAIALTGCSSNNDIKSEENRSNDILNCHEDSNSIVKGSDVNTQDPDSKRAILLIVKEGNSISVCTGAAISDRVILTAGHCVKGVADANITAIFHPEMTCASGYDRTSMTITSEKILTHEKYKGGNTAKNDLALIRLSAQIPASYPIATIYDGKSPLSNDDVLMIGYGETNMRSGDSLKLRKTVKSIKNDSLIDGHKILFDQSNSTGGVCSGDSGGPIYVKVQGQYQIIGVNSVVMGKNEYTACHEASAGMYAPHYAPWILENLLELQ